MTQNTNTLHLPAPTTENEHERMIERYWIARTKTAEQEVESAKQALFRANLGRNAAQALAEARMLHFTKVRQTLSTLVEAINNEGNVTGALYAAEKLLAFYEEEPEAPSYIQGECLGSAYFEDETR